MRGEPSQLEGEERSAEESRGEERRASSGSTEAPPAAGSGVRREVAPEETPQRALSCPGSIHARGPPTTPPAHQRRRGVSRSNSHPARSKREREKEREGERGEREKERERERERKRKRENLILFFLNKPAHNNWELEG